MTIIILQVRDFHKKFYRPENVTVILTGQIEAPSVFSAIEIIENDILAKVNFCLCKTGSPWLLGFFDPFSVLIIMKEGHANKHTSHL